MARIPICLTGDIDDGLESIESCLRPFADTLDSYDVKVTIPVTATALARNPRGIALLLERGHEIAGHGDIHVGFQGPVDDQIRRLREMNLVFQKLLGITPRGFRAPYLRHDPNLYLALSAEGFLYDSSRIFKDPLLHLRYMLSNRKLTHDAPVRNLPRVLRGYVSGATKPRPFFAAGRVLEFPVFDLDDWFFYEYANGPRLDPTDDDLVSRLWHKAWRHGNRKGNVHVLQAHPKRISPNHLRAIEGFITLSRESGGQFLTLTQLASRFRSEGMLR